MPTVSVLLPTLDAMPHLERALASIEEQSLSDIEIIVADGGSSDGTVDCCYQTSYPVKILQVGGLVESLRAGVNAATGKYIARVDADSISSPRRFEKQLFCLENNDDLAVVGSHATKLIESTGATFIDKKPINHESICRGLVFQNQMIHPTMMLRRDAVKDVGNYREYHWEDYELLTRFADVNNNYQLMNVDENLVTVHKRKDSITGKTAITKRVKSNLECGRLAIERSDYNMYDSVWLRALQYLYIGKLGFDYLKT